LGDSSPMMREAVHAW